MKEKVGNSEIFVFPSGPQRPEKKNPSQLKRKRDLEKTHQDALDAGAIDAGGAQVGQDNVVVGATRDEGVAALLQACFMMIFF